MSEVTLYIASSIDGFIADEDGGVDWLSAANLENEDYGYSTFYQDVDTLIMGRKTYEFCLGVEKWPYEGKQTFVFTSQTLNSRRDDVNFLSGDTRKAFTKMLEGGAENIWLVGGGIINAEFLKANLIDKLIITIIPVVLGKGIKLFSEADEERFILERVESYKSSVVQVHFSINRESE